MSNCARCKLVNKICVDRLLEIQRLKWKLEYIEENLAEAAKVRTALAMQDWEVDNQLAGDE